MLFAGISLLSMAAEAAAAFGQFKMRLINKIDSTAGTRA